MMRSIAVLLLVAATSPAWATTEGEALRANPIRKVVTMLQTMQKKVEAEGEKEKELFEKYMCYCKTSGGDLGKSISAAEAAIPELESDIKEAEEQKAQLEEDLKQHQADRSAAKKAMAEATALRRRHSLRRT